MKRIMTMITVSLLAAAGACGVDARRFSLSTNMLDYANFATLNVEASYGVARHWSVNAGAKLNPFTFRLREKGTQMQNRQQSYELGVRMWPWHIFSGWWVAAKAKYKEYNTGGIISSRTEEGDSYGLGFTAGYSYMLHPNLNLEFGIGFWTGVRQYTVYECPSCGLTTETGTKGFILPNEILLSLVYVF